MPHSQEFVAEMKQKLLEEKSRLESELAGLAPHTEMGQAYDENAEEVNVDEVNQDLIVRIQSDLAKIDAALEKTENNTYGIDGDGKEIGEARLRALPWADKAI